MKVKKSDFGYNLENIQDAEQKSFMDNILGAMCDVVNKANEGLIAKEDIDAQFNAINEKLQGYDAEKFEQMCKDNNELREMLKKSMDVIAKAQEKGNGMNVISKFDEKLNEMFDSEKFQDFVEGRTRKSGAFEGFSLKDIVSIFANTADSDAANYTGSILISQQDQNYYSKWNPAKLHMRDVLNVVQGDPQYPTYTFGQVASVDRNVRYVNENGELPASSISLKEVTAQTVRVGTHISVSKRMLKSRIFLRSYLLDTLPDRIYLAEDWNILFGDGSGDQLLSGLAVGKTVLHRRLDRRKLLRQSIVNARDGVDDLAVVRSDRDVDLRWPRLAGRKGQRRKQKQQCTEHDAKGTCVFI